MEFGIFNGAYVPASMVEAEGPAAEVRRFKEELEWVKAADRSGFKYLWATEHHFLEEYSHLSANESFLGYCAAITERIHIGSGIFNITPPVNHPARVAERVAMLDLLSDGRFELGMGRGSSTTEQAGFGITDPDLTREMFDEALPEIVKMWRPGTYPGFEGRFFTMPERNVLPKPVTQPHPPLWVAAGSPSTFEKAAQLGVGVLCFTTGTSDQLKPLIERYKEQIGHADPVGEYVNDNVAVTTSFMCLESRDEARELLTRSGNGRQQSLVFKYLDTFPKPPGIPEWPQEIPDPTLDQIEKGFQSGGAIVGTPDDCAAGIQKWVDIGVDQLIMGPSGSTYPHELLERTVTLFGDEVIPRFDKDPEHSTSKYRAAAAG
jgi:alkanesulfonate monooxygenase SsuD/methylene tetrahydromethanopterin reductase-like flavin-dependent oxidoreductase (luciferase family)